MTMFESVQVSSQFAKGDKGNYYKNKKKQNPDTFELQFVAVNSTPQGIKNTPLSS